jgi:hypothetical protein
VSNGRSMGGTRSVSASRPARRTPLTGGSSPRCAYQRASASSHRERAFKSLRVRLWAQME